MGSWKDNGLTIIDNVICLCLIFPLSVLHWRGTWQLQDEYFVPENSISSGWISLTVGANICILELLLQPMLKEHLDGANRYVYVVISRLHLYIHGWAVMCYWRGLWNLLDLYLTAYWVNSVVIYGVCQVTMVVFRTVRTPVGVPLAVQLDTDPDLLEPDIVFKTSHDRLIPFVLDCLFTQFVIVSSSICIWRGIWNIADAFIFPHIKGHPDDDSDLVSLLFGLLSTFFFLILQYPTSQLSARLDSHPWAKIAFEDALFTILMWSNMLLWRGSWNLCIRHFLPKRHVGSWVSHWIGTVGLMVLQVFNNVGLHGIVRDGTYMRGEGIYVTHYLRILLQNLSEVGEVNKTDYDAFENEKDHRDVPPSSDNESADEDLSSIEEHRKLLGKRSKEIGTREDSVKTADFISGSPDKSNVVCGDDDGVKHHVGETTTS